MQMERVKEGIITAVGAVKRLTGTVRRMDIGPSAKRLWPWRKRNKYELCKGKCIG